mmetsp:Transcript_43669/g.132175  ORF Transcript_43669/g.132175 Transcript_43669/m.132175 type:complete len:302 (+) Transcript_43669:240-1145(+)
MPLVLHISLQTSAPGAPTCRPFPAGCHTVDALLLLPPQYLFPLLSVQVADGGPRLRPIVRPAAQPRHTDFELVQYLPQIVLAQARHGQVPSFRHVDATVRVLDVVDRTACARHPKGDIRQARAGVPVRRRLQLLAKLVVDEHDVLDEPFHQRPMRLRDGDDEVVEHSRRVILQDHLHRTDGRTANGGPQVPHANRADALHAAALGEGTDHTHDLHPLLVDPVFNLLAKQERIAPDEAILFIMRVKVRVPVSDDTRANAILLQSDRAQKGVPHRPELDHDGRPLADVLLYKLGDAHWPCIVI